MNPEPNVKLLRKIKRHILAQPKRLLMRSVVARKNDTGFALGDDHRELKFPPCGTAACIAGWALILSKKEPRNGWLGMRQAAKLLRVPYRPLSDDAGNRLFLARHWPFPFADRYITARTPRRRAQLAARRIEHFIKTGK